MTNKIPTHPGLILKQALLQHKIMWTDFADRIDVDDKVIAAILNQTAAITPALSVRFSRFFNQEIDYWLKIQVNYELSLVVFETSYAKQFEVDLMKLPLPDRFG